MTIINRRKISTIEDDLAALFTFTSDELVQNFGSLITAGNGADGIRADADGVMIENFGSIATSGLGSAGIHAVGDNVTITNRGSVTTSGDPLFGELFAEGITVFGNHFKINNRGQVNVEGQSASALSGIGDDGVITNEGRVNSTGDNNATVAVLGDRSDAINAASGVIDTHATNSSGLYQSGFDGHAINYGLIMTEGSNSAGIASFNGGAINGGTIRSTGTSANGVFAQFSDVLNEGTIKASGDDAVGVFAESSDVLNNGTIKASGDGTAGVVALLGGDVLNDGAIEASGDNAIGVFASEVDITNHGWITAKGASSLGIVAVFANMINTSAVHAKGQDAIAIEMFGAFNTLTNSGTIEVSNEGHALSGSALSVFGIFGGPIKINNEAEGIIRSENPGTATVYFDTPFAPSALFNKGLIESSGVAIEGVAGNQVIENAGLIRGDVNLGSDDDVFVALTGGQVTGSISLGAGNDRMYLLSGSGKTVVADFIAGDASGDQIDLSPFFDSFAEILGASIQIGTDTLIALNDSDTLRLHNVDLATLNVDDFHFIDLSSAYAAGISNGFDFSVDITNDVSKSSPFYDEVQSSEANVLNAVIAAMQDLGRYITGALGSRIDVHVSLIDSAEFGRLAAASATNYDVIIKDGQEFLQPNTISELNGSADYDLFGSDIEIFLNARGLVGSKNADLFNFFTDTAPDRDVPAWIENAFGEPIPQHDLVSVLTHEITHGLGIAGFGPGPFQTTFDRLIEFSSEEAPYFTGQAAAALYGESVPLWPDLAHWLVESDLAGGLMSPFSYPGDRAAIGALELAALKDLGLNVTIPDDLGLVDIKDDVFQTLPVFDVGPYRIEGDKVIIEVTTTGGDLNDPAPFFPSNFPTDYGVGFHVEGTGGDYTDRLIVSYTDAGQPMSLVVAVDASLFSADELDTGLEVTLFSPSMADLPNGERSFTTTISSDVLHTDYFIA